MKFKVDSKEPQFFDKETWVITLFSVHEDRLTKHGYSDTIFLKVPAENEAQYKLGDTYILTMTKETA